MESRPIVISVYEFLEFLTQVFECTKTRGWRRDEFSKCFAIREKVGGRDRDRTGDPLLAKQVLSQLSYTPTVGTTFDSKAFASFRKLRNIGNAVPESNRAVRDAGIPGVNRLTPLAFDTIGPDLKTEWADQGNLWVSASNSQPAPRW